MAERPRHRENMQYKAKGRDEFFRRLVHHSVVKDSVVEDRGVSEGHDTVASGYSQTTPSLSRSVYQSYSGSSPLK